METQKASHQNQFNHQAVWIRHQALRHWTNMKTLKQTVSPEPPLPLLQQSQRPCEWRDTLFTSTKSAELDKSPSGSESDTESKNNLSGKDVPIKRRRNQNVHPETISFVTHWSCTTRARPINHLSMMIVSLNASVSR